MVQGLSCWWSWGIRPAVWWWQGLVPPGGDLLEAADVGWGGPCHQVHQRGDLALVDPHSGWSVPLVSWMAGMSLGGSCLCGSRWPLPLGQRRASLGHALP